MTELSRHWRLIEDDALDGADNMARDAGLLRLMERRIAAGSAVRPALRLYGWRPATISIGKHQTLEDACDAAACAAAGVDVVRRPTGGRGVLHEEDEVTYSVIAPTVGPFAGTGVTAAAAAISAALVLGLRALGASAETVRGAAAATTRLRRGACFASTSKEEIIQGGRKLLGSAQFRARASLLQHGSLPLRLDAERHGRLLAADPAVLRAKAVSLEECLEPGRPMPSRAAVNDALVRGFSEGLGVSLERSSLDPDELDAARAHADALRRDRDGFRRAELAPCSR